MKNMYTDFKTNFYKKLDHFEQVLPSFRLMN